MSRYIPHLLVATILPCWLLSVATSAHAQLDNPEWRKALAKAEEEYRVFFKKPQTPLQFWAAIDFELDTGKYDVAGVHLHQLLLKPKDDVNKALLKVEAVKGLSHFLRLRQVTKWFDDPILNKRAKAETEQLIGQLSLALKLKLSDPVRLRKFVKLLNAPLREQRSYAFDQIRRSGANATPYLVEGLMATAGTDLHDRLKRAILALDDSIMVPMLEILQPADKQDFQAVDLRYAVLELFRKKKDTRAVPYLWHMSHSEKYPPFIQSQAKKTLAKLLGVDEQRLPDAKTELTRLAERYAQHRVRYQNKVYPVPPPGQPPRAEYFVKIWLWERAKVKVVVKGKEMDTFVLRLTPQPELVPANLADYVFAGRYARQALDLDPGHKPAQQVLLNMLLELQFGDNLNQFILSKTPKKYHSLLATVDADLLITLLEKAMSDRNLTVVLPLVRILGERGEVQALRASNAGISRGLVRALYYPDRRVQYEAARAMTRIPGRHSTVITARTVQILKRFLATPNVAQLLAIGIPEAEKLELRQSAEKAGWKMLYAKNQKEALQAIHGSAAIDGILVHRTYPEYDLPFLLSRLQSDADAGRTPILLMAPRDQHDGIRVLSARYPSIVPALEAITVDADLLKGAVEAAINQSMAPKYVAKLLPSQRRRVLERLANVKGVKFTAAERQRLTADALDLFWRMAQGKIKGYYLNPAKDEIYVKMQSGDAVTAEKAVTTYASFKGTDVQQRLAAVLLDGVRDKKVRMTAAGELIQHVKSYGLYLNRFQLSDLRDAYNTPNVDEDLRRQLAILVGTIPRNSRVIGLQLKNFNPEK